MNYDKLFEIFVICDLNVETTLKYLEEHFTFTDILISHNFLDQWNKIRTIYLDCQVIDPRSIDIEPKIGRVKQLVDFLCNENDFNKTYVLNKIIHVITGIYSRIAENTILNSSDNEYNEKLLNEISSINIEHIYDIFNNLFVREHRKKLDLFIYN